jgi:hypothetical protein
VNLMFGSSLNCSILSARVTWCLRDSCILAMAAVIRNGAGVLAGWNCADWFS